MTANQAEYSIQMMSRTLGVSRSGFYAYHSRPPSVRQVADEALSKRVTAIHEASKETYGAPRIHAELADEGIFVGRKRVERLMLAKGLRGVSRRKFVVTTERDPRVRPAADLVYRNFYAHAPNVLWVADITFVPTWTGFLYLAVVLDAFSRRVVGWAMGTHQRTQRVLDAMNMAVTQRKPSSVIHHSDQGSQYTSNPMDYEPEPSQYCEGSLGHVILTTDSGYLARTACAFQSLAGCIFSVNLLVVFVSCFRRFL
ncbi:IS3 family transposase [Aliisedimentitalea sp. MJ-SS2]|uniref:IS3 family transposase n=1 Tax=Aliisedimentitalea sp. MJ-SS2 TaxID=3049795 RepID=UPI0034600E6E